MPDKSETIVPFQVHGTPEEEFTDIVKTAEAQGVLDAIYMSMENQFEVSDFDALTGIEKETLVALFKPILVKKGLLQNVG